METVPIAIKGVSQRVVCNDFVIDNRTLRRWLKKGYIWKSKDNHIDPAYRTTLLPLWQSTCQPIYAEKKLGVHHQTIQNWKKKGKLESISICGITRLTINSVEKAWILKTLRQESSKENENPREEILRKREEKHILLSQTKPKKSKYRPRPKPASPKPKYIQLKVIDYKPELIQLNGLENRRLTTLDEAAKATGESVYNLERLFRHGGIRGLEHDGKIYLYINSVQARQTKLQNGIRFRKSG